MLRLRQQVKAIKAIARTLSMSKNTVKSYLQKVENGAATIEELLLLEDTILNVRLFAGSPLYKEQLYC